MRLQLAHVFGRELAEHQLAVQFMGGIVGGGQDMRRPPEAIHHQRRHAALRAVGDRAGEVGGEVLRPVCRFAHRGPGCDEVEIGVTDPDHSAALP